MERTVVTAYEIAGQRYSESDITAYMLTQCRSSRWCFVCEADLTSVYARIVFDGHIIYVCTDCKAKIGREYYRYVLRAPRCDRNTAIDEYCGRVDGS